MSDEWVRWVAFMLPRVYSACFALRVLFGMVDLLGLFVCRVEYLLRRLPGFLSWVKFVSLTRGKSAWEHFLTSMASFELDLPVMGIYLSS